MTLLKPDALRENVRKALEKNRIRGAEIRIVQNGEEVLNLLYGEKSAGVPLPANTMFRMASMTKPVTSIAFLMEVAKGHLDPEDELRRYLPKYDGLPIAYEKDGERHEKGIQQTPIKLWHLLSHTSGIGSGGLAWREIADVVKDMESIEQMVDKMTEIPLEFDPETAVNYSPTGAFDVMGRVIEMTSGVPYDEYLQKNIFDPLGMIDTTFYPTDEQWARMITMTNVDKEGNIIDGNVEEGFVFSKVRYPMAGGGLASTGDDYLKFANMLLAGGKTPEGKELLPPEIFKLLVTPRLPKKLCGENEAWGLGVRVLTGATKTFPKGIFGWSGAWGTHFWVDPLNQVIAILLRNNQEPNTMNSDFEKAVMASM